jgi:hypothetical protein
LDRLAPKVLALVALRRSRRLISRELGKFWKMGGIVTLEDTGRFCDPS